MTPASLSAVPASELHPRAAIDLQARQQVFGPGREIHVPADGEEFWHWYASTVRCGRPFSLRLLEDAPAYPEPDREVALWFSGGAESSYTLEQIRHLSPDLLDIADFAVFSSEHRGIGQIHFLCAVIAASLGYRRAFLGVERQDWLLARTEFARGYVDRSPEFITAWSGYQPEHQLETVCGEMYKEEILLWLAEHGIRVTGTCDRLDGGRWCADCYKCFEAFYTAKAVGLDLGYRLTPRAFDTYGCEYRRFVDSGFTDNFNNAYQHYVRLQILYQVRFDSESDCAGRQPGQGEFDEWSAG